MDIKYTNTHNKYTHTILKLSGVKAEADEDGL